MYYLLFGFLYLLSLLPMRVLYLLSDVAYFIVYRLMGYRKEVVMGNLAIAFPQKSEAERIAIAKKFYRNFTDTFIETIKFISAPPSFFDKRFSADFRQVHEVYKDGRSIQFHLGHNFNWELANLAVPKYLPDQLHGVYLTINAKPIDRLFRYIRGRFGTYLIPANRMREEMLRLRDQQYILGLIADQSPSIPHKAHWTMFFGRPTAFLKQPEAAARRNDLPVFFAHFTKPRRGHYVCHAELAAAHPAELPEGALTRQYAQYLERVMTEQPELWLWSHRRWKYEHHPHWPLL
ncbi:lysophospholipid acyltransferase family protein [Flaviaesturariibacter amylovorans]|uniref:Acetyltransferase n=1 Tax=Flaviaesturariibacter amylovorans TaxID=1084520 RepID=A0ABP8GBE3_9BACT